MSHDDALVAQLAELFRGEVADAIRGLEVAVTELERPERRGDALSEVYRLVHGVKGAARAVGDTALGESLHALEDKLDRLRRAPQWDVADLRRLVHDAIHALGADVEPIHSHRGGPEHHEDRSGEQAPTVADPLTTTRVRMSALLEVLASAEDAMMALDQLARPDVDDRGEDGTIAMELERARRLLADDAPRTAVAAALASASAKLGSQRAAREAEHMASRLAQESLRTAVHRTAERARSLGAVTLSDLVPTLKASAGRVAEELGKDVFIEADFVHAELDRRIVDAIREPLQHLVANAIDHGIEAAEDRLARGKPRVGSLRLAARVHGHAATIEVIDDGRGFDLEGLRAAAERTGVPRERFDDDWLLAFEPGVTTREVAGPVSGRGVGLDAVRRRIASLRGRLSVETEPGEGTRVAITLPVDLSVIRALVARVGLHAVALATTNIERLGRIDRADLSVIESRTYVRADNRSVPFIALSELLGFHQRLEARSEADSKILYVMVVSGERRVALGVDAFVREREIVIKPFGRRVRRVPYVSAATIIERGEVALVLEPAAIVATARPGRAAEDSAAISARTVLVVDDSVTTRQLERAVLEAAGFRVLLAEDGAVAWRLLTSEPVDVVVTDVEMPNMDGFELLTRIRGLPSVASTPVVLVTALSSEHDRRRGLDLGANAYILKSQFDQDELLAVLRSFE